MSDQCKHCTARGKVAVCETTECSWHDLWYVKHLRARGAALEEVVVAARPIARALDHPKLLAALAKLDDGKEPER